jgi:hypothetical protein
MRRTGVTVANGTPHAWRQERRSANRHLSLQCSKYPALVLSMFSHYLLFDPVKQGL